MIRVRSGAGDGGIYLVSGVLGDGGKLYGQHIAGEHAEGVDKAHEAAGVKLVQLPGGVSFEDSGLYTTKPAPVGGGAVAVPLSGTWTTTNPEA